MKKKSRFKHSEGTKRELTEGDRERADRERARAREEKAISSGE